MPQHVFLYYRSATKFSGRLVRETDPLWLSRAVFISSRFERLFLASFLQYIVLFNIVFDILRHFKPISTFQSCFEFFNIVVRTSMRWKFTFSPCALVRIFTEHVVNSFHSGEIIVDDLIAVNALRCLE